MTVLACLFLLLAMIGHSSCSTYCVCKDGVGEQALQGALDYACGHGADCSAIQPNGACFNPNTVKDHCSYAVNSYYQNSRQVARSCNFSDAAIVTSSAPKNIASTCRYPTSSTGTPGTTSTPGTPGTTPTTGTPGTTPSTGTPGTTPSTGTPGTTPSTGTPGTTPTTGTPGTTPTIGTPGTTPTTGTPGTTPTIGTPGTSTTFGPSGSNGTNTTNHGVAVLRSINSISLALFITLCIVS